VKNNLDNQIQNITVCYVFFERGISVCNGGWGKASSGAKPPEAGEFSRIFVLKVTLQSVKLLLTKLQKKWGNRMYYLFPNNFVGSNCSPRFPCLCVHYCSCPVIASCSLSFYRAMHFSAKRGIEIAYRLSVCP